MFDCLIIGSGPAGITAGTILKRKGLSVALIDDGAPGGKVNIAPRVDNYPPYERISGPDLAVEFFLKMNEAGLELIGERVENIKPKDHAFEVLTNRSSYSTKTILVASGTIERKLGLPDEDRLFAHGISYCALCDGHFFKGQDVAVIGGGDSAVKEAIHLAGLASTLYVVHRRNEFRADKATVDELLSYPNVKVLTPYIPVTILGKDKLEGLIIENVLTHDRTTLHLAGLFPLVGQDPNTSFLEGLPVLDEGRNLIVDKDYMSKVDGLFGAGDVLSGNLRQIYVAVDDAGKAAESIVEYLGR